MTGMSAGVSSKTDRRKPFTIKLELTQREMNYAIQSVHCEILALERGPQYGNIPELIRISKRLRSKLRRIDQDAMRKRMGEKKWREHRKYVNQLIRDARKRRKA